MHPVLTCLPVSLKMHHRLYLVFPELFEGSEHSAMNSFWLLGSRSLPRSGRGGLLAVVCARPRRAVDAFPLSQLAFGRALLTWRYLTSRLLPYSMTHWMTSHRDVSQERHKLLIPPGVRSPCCLRCPTFSSLCVLGDSMYILLWLSEFSFLNICGL